MSNITIVLESDTLDTFEIDRGKFLSGLPRKGEYIRCKKFYGKVTSIFHTEDSRGYFTTILYLEDVSGLRDRG